MSRKLVVFAFAAGLCCAAAGAFTLEQVLSAPFPTDLTDRVKSARIYQDEIRERPGELLFLFRESMSAEFQAMGVPMTKQTVATE